MTKHLEDSKITRLKDLMFVVDECRGYPRLKALHDSAMAELEELSEEIAAGPQTEVEAAPVEAESEEEPAEAEEEE